MKGILYITSQFPTLTETFIAREMQELVNRGNKVTIAVIRHQKSVLGEVGITVDAARVFRYPVSFPIVLFDTAFALLAAPSAYLHCPAELLQNFIRQPKYILASIYIFFRFVGYIGFSTVRAFNGSGRISCILRLLRRIG